MAGRRRPLCVRGPRVRGPQNPRTGTDGEGGSGYADRPAQFLLSDLLLQAVGSLPAAPSSPGSWSASGALRASVMRWLAASACPSMQWA